MGIISTCWIWWVSKRESISFTYVFYAFLHFWLFCGAWSLMYYFQSSWRKFSPFQAGAIPWEFKLKKKIWHRFSCSYFLTWCMGSVTTHLCIHNIRSLTEEAQVKKWSYSVNLICIYTRRQLWSWTFFTNQATCKWKRKILENSIKCAYACSVVFNTKCTSQRLQIVLNFIRCQITLVP